MKFRSIASMASYTEMSEDGEGHPLLEIVKLFGVVFLLFMLVLSKLLRQLKGHVCMS